MDESIDILMITYNRAAYTRLSLARLLETCDQHMRVWLWHNGDDAETLAAVREHLDHPAVHTFHHSPENRKLREPTCWLWRQSQAAYLCKVDDDCLMPHGWAAVLRKAHADEPRFGILGCWRFPDEDYAPELAERKIETFTGGHRILRNCWIEGSGYLMKRACVADAGLLRDGESFTRYGVRLARRGWVHGWYFPFLYQEHMDDPRSEHTMLKTDADLHRHLPLTAANNGATTIAQWTDVIRRDARCVQAATTDPAYYMGWRPKARRLARACRWLTGKGSAR